MGLLTVCAHHYEGLAWLVGFYLLLCYTPHLYRGWTWFGGVVARRPEAAPVRQSLLQDGLFFTLIASIAYVGGTLPCGRFYYENVDGFFGNSFLRLSYEYVYLYLGFLAHVVDRVERVYALGGLGRRPLLRALAGVRGSRFSATRGGLSQTPPTLVFRIQGGLRQAVGGGLRVMTEACTRIEATLETAPVRQRRLLSPGLQLCLAAKAGLGWLSGRPGSGRIEADAAPKLRVSGRQGGVLTPLLQLGGFLWARRGFLFYSGLALVLFCLILLGNFYTPPLPY
jgi:hypothetical protein